MTSLAIESGVDSSQWEVCELVVIEFRTEPAIHAVADGAVGGKAQRLVVDNRGLIVLLMTRKALRRKAEELSRGSTGMA